MIRLFCNYLTIKGQQKPSVVKIKFSFIYFKLLTLLLKEGFIRAFYVNTLNDTKILFIILKYVNGRSFFKFKPLNITNANFYHNSSINSLNFTLLSNNKGIFIRSSNSITKNIPFCLLQIILI